MRILVLSDIHAMSREIKKLEGYAGPSGGNLMVEERTTLDNPILAIPSVLQGMEIDALLCLGDLTHQAKQLPLMAAWHDVHKIARDLSIPQVFGVIGNHDVQSRAETTEDVEALTEFLQQIDPPFPSDDEEFNDKYFAHGVAGKSLGDCFLIAFDTCRTHGKGFGKEAAKQIYERGALTNPMVAKARKLADACEEFHILVAMHHHPLPVTPKDTENDQMENGAKLLDVLQSTGKNVILLHGHKHYVSLKNHRDDVSAPLVLSSASLSAYPFDHGETHFSNQFHVLEIDINELDNPTGTVHSWDWGANTWAKSKRPHMPGEVHFGGKPNLPDLVDKIRVLPKKPMYNKEELFASIFQLRYVDEGLINCLNQKLSAHGYRLIFSAGEVSGMIYEEDRK